MTVRRSTIFEVGDVVRVPFPFVEREQMRSRPALIISCPHGPDGTIVWTLMITSAERSAWPGDIAVGDDHALMGLPIPCYVRTAKVAALETASVERRLGKLTSPVWDQVCERIRAVLPWL